MKNSERFRVEVKHDRPTPLRYCWQIYDGTKPLPMQESSTGFASWEEASRAGKAELKCWLKARAELG
jgi:hypothetical protein